MVGIQMRVAFGWLFSTAICLTVIFSAHDLMDKKHNEYNVWATSAYAGLYRLGWSLGLAWVVMACILGYGGKALTEGKAKRTKKK